MRTTTPFASALTGGAAGLETGMKFAQQQEALKQKREAAQALLPYKAAQAAYYAQKAGQIGEERRFIPQEQQDKHSKIMQGIKEGNAKTDQIKAQTGEIPTQHNLNLARTDAAKTRAAFTPEKQLQSQLAVQQLRNQGQMDMAKMRIKAQKTNDPFAISQAQQLTKDMTQVNDDAAHAADVQIPVYSHLLTLLHQVPINPGPLGGHLMWTSRKGQEFLAYLTRAQGGYIKGFHLGRMTQLEFNFLKGALGKKTTYPETLHNLFMEQLAEEQKHIAKQEYYFNYIKGGGRQAEEAAADWTKKTEGQREIFEKRKYDDWLGRAKKINPAVSEKDLKDYYDKHVRFGK
jgi:hypothetical protein